MFLMKKWVVILNSIDAQMTSTNKTYTHTYTHTHTHIYIYVYIYIYIYTNTYIYYISNLVTCPKTRFQRLELFSKV